MVSELIISYIFLLVLNAILFKQPLLMYDLRKLLLIMGTKRSLPSNNNRIDAN
jgi:hypothetical protein